MARIHPRSAALAPLLSATLFALPNPAGSQTEELPEYLQALGYAEWTEHAEEVGKRGVVLFDRERTSPGYNLYADNQDQVFLMDLAGEHVHSWRVPAHLFDDSITHCEHARLLRGGMLAVLCRGKGLAVLDWDSKPIATVRGYFHHAIAELPGGPLLMPASSRRVDYLGRKVKFDGLVVWSPADWGFEVWSSKNQLGELQNLHPPLALDTPPAPGTANKQTHDYYHLNSIQLLPETELGRTDPRFRPGNYLLSLRNANLVVILDKKTRRVVWSYGPGVLELQHAPTMLANGNILIFDNGTHRGYSRIIELEPKTGAIAWEYRGSPTKTFFSKWRGLAQRLDNGNTLITESGRGHVFEVTRAGEIVWEFWNPDMKKNGKRRRIYRMTRLPPDRVLGRLRERPPPSSKPDPEPDEAIEGEF